MVKGRANMTHSSAKNRSFDTVAIHGNKEKKNASNALNAPIFMTSTFTFENTDHVADVMSFKSDDYVYTRGNNPTLREFENRIADLEGGAGAVAFASGMAAISSTLLSLLAPGDLVIAHRTLYGSAHSFIEKLLTKYKVNYAFEDLTDLTVLEKYKNREDLKVIYFETPANPTLDIIDIKAIVAFAKENNAKTVVDNTFASPYFQQPLAYGVDVVVHSATKYICGHGDVIAGVAVSKDENYIQSLKFEYMCELGGAMSPFNAWLLLRGLKTLGVRMRQHEANAMAVATFLEAHPKVTKVYYPGLKSFKGHELAKAQMKGFGAVIAFEVKGDIETAKRVVNNVEMFKLAVSLGDCETLIEMPAAMTHLGYDREQLASFGLSEEMIRLSIGIEAVEDIIEDLRQALERI